MWLCFNVAATSLLTAVVCYVSLVGDSSYLKSNVKLDAKFDPRWLDDLNGSIENYQSSYSSVRIVDMGQHPAKPTQPASTEADELMKVFYPDWIGQYPPHGIIPNSQKLPKVKNPSHHTLFEHLNNMFNLMLDAGWWLTLFIMRGLSVRLLLFHLSLALVACSEEHGFDSIWLCPSCIEDTLSWLSLILATIVAVVTIMSTLGPVIRHGTPLRVINILYAGSLAPWFLLVFLCVWGLEKWKESLEIDYGTFLFSQAGVNLDQPVWNVGTS